MAEQPVAPPNRPGGAPAEPSGTAAGPAGGDPSMEDILASSRRILNEEEQAAPPDPPAAPPPDEPLDLTREMLVGGPSGAATPLPAPPPPAPPPPATPVTAPQAQAEPKAPVEPPGFPVPTAAVAGALLAPAAAAAASASVGHLLRAVAAERGSAVRSGGPTIEDVVREELRPLLKEWLDQHLPAVVERLVRAEIERVVGRALS
jgi:uncharacterized protein